MHARYGSGQNHGTAQSLPPSAAPGILKDKEEGEGRGAGEYGDDDGANEVGEAIRAPVVADGRIGEVVHATNGTAREQSREDNSPPSDSTVAVDTDKGEHEHEDGHKEGGDGEGGRVGDLEGCFAVEHVDGSVANKVLPRHITMLARST